VTDVALLALSEPLFLLVFVLTACEMLRHPERSWTAGILAAVANLVRYAGVFLVASVGLWGALQPGPPNARVRRAAVALVSGALLHLDWRLIGIVPGGGANADAYGGLGQAVQEGWSTALGWLTPGLHGGAATAVAGTVVVLLAVAIGLASRGTGADHRRLFG